MRNAEDQQLERAYTHIAVRSRRTMLRVLSPVLLQPAGCYTQHSGSACTHVRRFHHSSITAAITVIAYQRSHPRESNQKNI